ncbi:MAG: ABC transporter ATP-binding protein [Candidatus Eremiobacteraeota bacterium]|nr:ABC transporter ATP-binding protein [Candidatus Eremiobacteraeota bacterium]
MSSLSVAPRDGKSASPAAREGVDAIRIERLSKRYGDVVAVDDLSLRVAAGDFFGFLGPNGAGKTTTINAIVGLVRSTTGSIEIFGHDATSDWRSARRLIGLAPQEYNFDRYLSIRDVLIYQAGYYGLPSRDVGARADELLERFGLASKSRDTFIKLSGGMKRRLTLARALIHSPRMLILDEPTAGVDVELRLELWSLLRELNASGTTIFLTTHYLEEAETLCRNIGIIESGRLVALEPTSRLLQRHGAASLVVRVDGPIPALPAGLAARAFAERDLGLIRIEGVDSAEVAEIVAALVRAGTEITAIDFGRASLQDVFLELTRK